MSPAWTELKNELVAEIAEAVVARLQAGAPGMISQAVSPLGRRRHCAAVRRRLARGEPGASVVGRRHLLSAEAIAEELARASAKTTPSTNAAPAGGVQGELERELRLVRGGQ